MHFKSLKTLNHALKSRSISSVELTQHFLDRINTYDPTLNSVITVTTELAMQQAKAADARWANGTAGPLTGIPMLQKDIFCTAGVRSSCGSKMLDNFISPYNATLIEQFNTAGAVMLGKANMDEFAMGSSNENSYYGPVANPWDTSRIPGGSSGGSAAAVAAGLAPAATGTDTGGSIRQPAAHCGITGLKPTYGRVSRFGMIAFASSLDQAGPMAQSAEDLAILMSVMAGHDPRDSTSIDCPVPDFVAELSNPIRGMTIGLPKEYFQSGLDPAVEQAIDQAIQQFEAMGVKTVPVSLPHTDYAASAYYVIAPAECSSNLARYDGVRYGYRCDQPTDLQDLYCRSRSEAFGDEVKRRIMVGTYVLSSGYYDAYYSKAQKIRRLIRDEFAEAFNTVDAILAPTTPSTAFKRGELCDDPVSMYLSDIYTIAVNLAGLPALAMPCGFDQQQLPIGVQLIGKPFDEANLLRLSHQFQQSTDWHQSHPTAYS